MTLRREWTRVRWAEYEDGLEPRLRDLHERVHRGSYRAQASRRIYLKKPDGRQRPIGIAALEDKIVQQSVVTILNAIYEEDFRGFSYGFRPGRSPQGSPLVSGGVGRAERGDRTCLLYTSDAADDLLCVDLGG